MLYRSRFAKYYRRGDNVCLFHSLTMRILFGNTALLDIFRSFPLAGDQALSVRWPSEWNPSIEALQTEQLLLENPEKDLLVLKHLRNKCKDRHQRRLTQLCLLPSSGCNMACNYCYIEKDPSLSAHMMSEDRASRAVEYFFRYSHNSRFRDIVFYGGEPLLNFRAVFAAADRANSLARNAGEDSLFTLRIVTNGLLIDDFLARELARRQIEVILSIDGPEELHDQSRRSVQGEGTFVKVMRAFDLLRKHCLEPTVSLTVTKKVLEEWERVLSFLSEELQPRAVIFNPLLPAARPNTKCKYDDESLLARSLVRAYKRLRSHGIHEDRVGRRVTPFYSMQFRYKDCPATAGQIAITPDGNIGPCQGLMGNPAYFPLHIDKDFYRSPLEHSVFQEWFDRFPLNYDKCINCPAISICGGGCAISALRDSSSIWHIDQRVCRQVKPIHQWLTWDLFAETMKHVSISDI